MGTEAEEQETENVVIESEAETVDVETEEPDAETSETEAEGESTEEPASEDSSGDSEDGGVIVTIGDTPPPEESEEQKAPSWVRELRKSHREMQRENRELKQKLEATNNPPAKQEVKLGAKPKLEDYDYDTEKYEQELTAWYDRKRQVDQQEADAKSAQEAQQKAWKQQLDSYAEKKQKLKVRDFDEAEANVLEAFDETQQGIVIQGADDPALTFYALGVNGAKLKELASIKDPVKFSFAVAKLETQLKVKNRKAPPPERTVSGTAPKSGAADSELERLREEASRTGDYSKIHRYKKQKRANK